MKKGLLIVWIICSVIWTPLQMATAQGGDNPPPPVAPPPDTNLPLTELIFDADFNDTDFWFNGESDTETATFGLTDNGYQISSTSAENGLSFVPPLNVQIDNFYVEIGFTINDCAIPESALLFFTRLGVSTQNALNSMVYVVQCNGSYRARPMIDSNIGPILTNGTTIALEEGNTYTMGLLMSEKNAVWYLNQTVVAEFETSNDVLARGFITPGVQAGLTYTLTSWRMWSLKNTTAEAVAMGASTEADNPTPIASDNPLAAGAIGIVLYRPTTDNPSMLPLGRANAAAAYIVGDSFNIYNSTPSAILPFTGFEGEDYYLETVFRIRGCEDTSSAGLVWRANTDYSSYYAFQITCDGNYRATLMQDGTATELVSGTITPSLQDTTGNLTVSVYVKGSTAWLYFQTNLLTSFEDDTLVQGHAGLILESGVNGEKMDILANSIVVTETR
ncbi:MAG: hypothetical protein H6673_01965 [Anaerolineales bacterium]|nr:hypothetical protein [Anaerolineales bacterium]